MVDNNIPDKFLEIINKMNAQLDEIEFPSIINYIYKTSEYARDPLEKYIRQYCSTEKKIMILAMNPGPFSSAQTGIPFGSIPVTRDWLNITGEVKKPPREAPNRPITGFDCNEICTSSQRFWEVFGEKGLCRTPDKFFKNAFLYNYFPWVFLESNGNNYTPATLEEKSKESKESKEASDRLIKICNDALKKLLVLFKVKIVFAIGRYAQDRANEVIKEIKENEVIEEIGANKEMKVFYFEHPSSIIDYYTPWKDRKQVWECILRIPDLLVYFQD